MSLFDTPVRSLSEADLQALITTQVAESRILDYKRDPIGSGDRDRQEFLADVSSFANAAGGNLIIGMDELNGLPINLIGCTISNPDNEILRLEQMIRTGIRPAIQGVESGAIQLSNGQIVIVLRIPRSWTAPHQVGQVGSFKIFGRGSNGKYQLDVDELRSLFRQGPELEERIRSFRENRLLRIIGNDVPVELSDGAKLILHIIPIGHFVSRSPVDIALIRDNRELLISLLERGGSIRVNVDGLLGFTPMADGSCGGYVQLYRDGTLEIVEYVPQWPVRGSLYLPGLWFDELIQRILAACCRVYDRLRVSAPLDVLLTLTGMRGWRMGAGQNIYNNGMVFDRDPVICPDVLIETLERSPAELARPVIDLAWNAAGFERSINYDGQGNWAPR